VTVEELPWGDGKRTLTKAYMLRLTKVTMRKSYGFRTFRYLELALY
jgi:hypothetical protein